ncbi:MAG: hypothetical protein J7L53_03895 [Deltaproteobacteria bacterium]|nr:hypothetical protein [Deltaproteobacteria bacterium]
MGPDTKLIVMSDMHRGDGSASDDFVHNSVIYKCALDYYLAKGFTYIELGDGEDLWEVEAFDQIYITHTSVYDKIRRFHHPDPKLSRYIKIWGNHDENWKHNESMLGNVFEGIRVYEAAIIDSGLPVRYTCLPCRRHRQAQTGIPSRGGRALLWHGHQADPLCSGRRASVSKFFVRHFWPRLQRFGVKDPTRAATNPGRCNEIDERLYQWVKDNDKGIDVIVAGHTHRPVYGNLSLTERKYLRSGITIDGIRKKLHPEPVYYNSGSCVHPRCITGIEITAENGKPNFNKPWLIKLVRWGYTTRSCSDGAHTEEYNLTIKRTVLEPQSQTG